MRNILVTKKRGEKNIDDHKKEVQETIGASKKAM
jgi:hypothetical protein